MTGFWYLASPYRAHPDGLGAAHAEACRWAACYLVEQGLIPRPRDLQCADCGSPAHEYDHARGYGADAQLYVEPVCRGCHHHRERSRRRG